MYRINPKILENTTDCPQDFACLKPGIAEVCEVDYVNGEFVSFLTTNEMAACPYRVEFGAKQVCSCPTRYQLYKKHQK